MFFNILKYVYVYMTVRFNRVSFLMIAYVRQTFVAAKATDHCQAA